MTFNTTSLPLLQAIKNKTLSVYPIVRSRGEQVRWLVVNPFVDDVLSGRQHFGEFPQVEAEILIGVYAAGHQTVE